MYCPKTIESNEKGEIKMLGNLGNVKKKLLSMVATLAFIGVLLLVPGNACAAKQSEVTIKRAYASYVKRNLSSTTKYPYGNYTLYDINRDGVPEMFFEYMSGVRSGFKIYTYKKGKVVKVKAATGISRIYYNSGKREICILGSGGAADNSYTCYKLSGKKLKKISSYRSISGNAGKVKFYKNEKRISRDKFSAYAEKIQKWKTITTY